MSNKKITPFTLEETCVTTDVKNEVNDDITQLQDGLETVIRHLEHIEDKLYQITRRLQSGGL